MSPSLLLTPKVFQEALADWHWLEQELLPTLVNFEDSQQVTDYVLVKVESLIADEKKRLGGALSVEDSESMPYRNAAERFQRLFNVGPDDKLVPRLQVQYFCCAYYAFICFTPLQVSYYSCSWWKGRLPSQGWLYLTVSHCAFYSFILGKESKLLLRWTDITAVEKSNNLLSPESIKLCTRDSEYHFSMFMHKGEAYSLIQQLANLGIRRLMADDGYQEDLDLLLKRSRNLPKKASFLKRDLDAKKMSEQFRLIFQVPNQEKLDGQVRVYTLVTLQKVLIAVLPGILILTAYLSLT